MRRSLSLYVSIVEAEGSVSRYESEEKPEEVLPMIRSVSLAGSADDASFCSASWSSKSSSAASGASAGSALRAARLLAFTWAGRESSVKIKWKIKCSCKYQLNVYQSEN